MAYKLTDTQLVILNTAAQHPERAVIVPARIRGGAVARVMGPLLAKGLVKEVAHRRGLVAYCTAEDGSQFAVVITDAGLEALGIAVEPKQTEISDADQEAATARTPRTGTKQALLIALLQRPEGATIEDAVAATGWLAHTVRGAMAGALEKRLGLAITSEKVEGRGRVYRCQA